MNDNSATPESRAALIAQLTQVTLAELNAAAGDGLKLQAATQSYVNRARAAHLAVDDMENILGIDEPSIMDLAQMSEADEEIVIAAFEHLTAT